MDKLTEKLLKLICSSSDGIQFYRIYRRMYLSPSEITQKLDALVNQGLIEIKQYSITPTEKGISFAMKNALLKRNTNESPEWKKIPSQFIDIRIPINKPYAPSYAKFVQRSKKT